MELKSYIEILKMGKEKLEESLIPVRAKKAQKQAELEMCDLDEKIATKESELLELTCNKDLNFKSIIDAQDALELLKRKRKQYEEIIKQLFPE